MLFRLLYCLPLLLKVWQRSGSCCFCYVIYNYCLRFDRGVVHVVLGGYSIYHYSLMFDRGVVHVVVFILSTITVLGMTEEWFILFLLYCLPLLFNVWQRSGSCCFGCLPLLFKVWQRSGSCFSCYIVYHYCSMFNRGVVHIVVVLLSTITVLGKTEEWFILLLLYCLQLLFKVWERSGSYCCCYNVYH
jgi:hypothetical protein